MTFYELVDLQTGNLIGTDRAEEEALAVVRRAARVNGTASIESLALGYEDDDGEGAQLAAGAALLARAQQADPGRLTRPA